MTILALAYHHRMIIMRKVPDYLCILHRSSSGVRLSVTVGTQRRRQPAYHDVPNAMSVTVLEVFFSSSSVQITFDRNNVGRVYNVDYADPKFTDDFLSDMLEGKHNV